MNTARVKLTAELVEAFAGTFLSPMYDNPQPTPSFHREGWGMYCSETELCAIAAPREHAKSTAFTHDYGLAVALFRDQDYIVIVSATEELAMGHLGDIAKELRENDDLIREFQIKELSVDTKSDIVVDFTDGHQCRFIAKGSGQKMRGLKWNGKRPGLILCDDLEEDEQVENLDRRKKFSRWFMRALLPCRRRGGKVRFHGTILHEDALLSRVMRSKDVWRTRLYKAHRAFDDFTQILWPEQFPESRLRSIRQAYIEDGDSDGYAQEYLNDPSDHSQSYLKRDCFLPMKANDDPNVVDDFDIEKKLYFGCDFAVSKADKANRTSFVLGGESADNYLHILDDFTQRWDTGEWIDKMFELEELYRPEAWFVEDGVIWKSVSPMIFKEMLKRSMWLHIVPILPVKDKAVRGQNYKKRHNSHGIKYDQERAGWEEYKSEVLKFTGVSDALVDDRFDGTAILCKGLDMEPQVEEDDFEAEEEREMREQDPRRVLGRNKVTGY